MNLLEMTFSGAVFITAVAAIRATAIHHLPKKTFLNTVGHSTSQAAASIYSSVHIQHSYTY